jgi:hypothetical protein
LIENSLTGFIPARVILGRLPRIGPSWERSKRQNDGGAAESSVASCELAKGDPFAWFQDVLTRIDEWIQQLDELLRHRWAAART